VVASIAEGCKQAGCALIGGETAEMPGMYSEGDYDLAGFCVGAVERDQVLTADKVAEGDVILGLASSGVHSNGFSLVRRLAADKGWKLDRPALFDIDTLLIDALMAPTRIYVKSLLPLVCRARCTRWRTSPAAVLLENIPRVLPDGLHAHVDADLLGAAAPDGVPAGTGQYRARGNGAHLQLRHRHGGCGRARMPMPERRRLEALAKPFSASAISQRAKRAAPSIGFDRDLECQGRLERDASWLRPVSPC
jgi:hypothetical protein